MTIKARDGHPPLSPSVLAKLMSLDRGSEVDSGEKVVIELG